MSTLVRFCEEKKASGHAREWTLARLQPFCKARIALTGMKNKKADVITPASFDSVQPLLKG